MKLLQDLIASPSWSEDYNQIIDVICKFVTDKTDGKIILQKISPGKANVIVTFGRPKLVINCHMDTVAPTQNWANNPHLLVQKGERLYGLGTADTKGNIYAVLEAVATIKPQNLMILLSVDEERGAKTGVGYFLESMNKEGIEKAIVCEPTSLRFVNKHKGYYSFWIEQMAKAGHSSIQNESAIVKMAKNVLTLDSLGFNIGRIEGGSAGNVISQSCKIKSSIRDYRSLEDISKELEANLNGAKVEPSFVGTSFLNENTLFQGINVLHEVNFWTEAALFAVAGIDTLVFGAGNIENAHTTDEFVEVLQLQNAVDKFKTIIEVNT